MPLKSFAELYHAADQLRTPVSVAVAGGADTTVIQAMELARHRGWVQPILTGNVEEIQERASVLEIDIAQFQLIEEQPDSAALAVQEVKEGRAKLLMKGQIATPYLMKAILNKEHGLRTGKTICQVVLMEVAKDQRSFLMTDTGVTVEPTLDQKVDFIQSVTSIAAKLGCKTPRIAMMSATEKVTAAMPDTEAADALVQLSSSGKFGDCVLQGPLSFDLAYAVDARTKKGIDGDVTGSADAMVFPNLLAANLTVKGIMYTANCQFGGILSGATAPVVFMSRADTVETRLNSLAYALQLLR